MAKKPRTVQAGTYLSIPEVALLIGVTEFSVREMIKDGRLKAYSLGPRIVRLKRDEVESAWQPYGVAY